MKEKMTSLATLGNWSRLELHSHQVIRHAYEEALTAAARLASFASGTSPRTDGPIDERQERLAVDDLIQFSIHARRLIENTCGHKRFINVSIRSKSSVPSPLRITRIINLIIHHREIEIIRDAWTMLSVFDRLTVDHVLRTDNKHFPPLVSVVSDGDKVVLFELCELIETFQLRVLRPITDLCDEHSLYLEDLD